MLLTSTKHHVDGIPLKRGQGIAIIATEQQKRTKMKFFDKKEDALAAQKKEEVATGLRHNVVKTARTTRNEAGACVIIPCFGLSRQWVKKRFEIIPDI